MRDIFEEKIDYEFGKPSKFLYNPKWKLLESESRANFKLDSIFTYSTFFWKHRIRFVIYPYNNDTNKINMFHMKMHKFYGLFFRSVNFLEMRLHIRMLFPALRFLESLGIYDKLIKEYNDYLTIDEVYTIYNYHIILHEE